MKKTFLLLVALVATVVGASAQGQTATLQQGDKMTPFYGPDAFVQAYNAAPQNGGVITLSAGNFNTVDSITKQVTIIGNGSEMVDNLNKTKLTPKTINHSGLQNNSTSLIINASNVRIEGISMDSVYIRKVSNTHFKRCYILSLHGTHIHKNTVVEQCFLSTNYTAAKGENLCFRNCFIEYSGGYLNMKPAYKRGDIGTAYFSNCLIYHWRDAWIQSSGISKQMAYAPKGTYVNCILGQRQYKESNDTGFHDIYYYWNHISLTPTYFYNYSLYNNVFFLYPYIWEENASGNLVEKESEDLKSMEMNMTKCVDDENHIGNTSSTWAVLIDEDATNWWEILKSDIPFKGNDGTVVGPYGGTGFSINPSIPRIVESKIDSNTDADGKLNVKIKVEVNQ